MSAVVPFLCEVTFFTCSWYVADIQVFWHKSAILDTSVIECSIFMNRIVISWTNGVKCFPSPLATIARLNSYTIFFIDYVTWLSPFQHVWKGEPIQSTVATNILVNHFIRGAGEKQLDPLHKIWPSEHLITLCVLVALTPCMVWYRLE